jgi:hypothetical protein
MLLQQVSQPPIPTAPECFTWGALILSTVGGILAGLAFFVWSWLWRKVTAWRFKQVFGAGVSENSFALIYAELALRSPSDTHPYMKPGGDPTAKFSMSHPVPISEVRAANYLSSSIGANVRNTPVLRSDADARALLDLDFVSFGGPRSNLKTADCQSNSPNTLALFDQMGSGFIAISNRQPLVQFQSGFDYAMILKVRPSQFPNRVWFACAGIGEWSTSGAAWFLANKWQEIRRKAGTRPFAAMVRVRPGQDQSAEMVRLLKS